MAGDHERQRKAPKGSPENPFMHQIGTGTGTIMETSYYVDGKNYRDYRFTPVKKKEKRLKRKEKAAREQGAF